MATYKIKSSIRLFSAWEELTLRISMLRSIVQNDMETTDQEVSDWQDTALNLNNDVSDLISETVEYLTKEGN